MLFTGFHLSASVNGTQPRTLFNVAVTFDRRKISSCNCTCQSTAYWCSHIVAVCLHRIHCVSIAEQKQLSLYRINVDRNCFQLFPCKQSHEVCLRAPVSESLTRLKRDQLQKFAQYLISELPQQILPTAQRLLDELLRCVPAEISHSSRAKKKYSKNYTICPAHLAAHNRQQ